MLPCGLATCAADGTPNVTMISQVHLVDDGHVALSCQFFNKTRRNLEENPYAALEICDPLTYEAWSMRVRFLRAETSGPLFEAMALRIQAIASHTGMSGVFRLLSADVCEVLQFAPITGYLSGPPVAPDVPPPDGPLTELRALQCLSARISGAVGLEDLLAITLDAFDSIFGFRHAMVLVPDGDDHLVTLASRGYEGASVGAEVRIGEGLIGTVARERVPLRAGGARDLRYGRAIRGRALESGGADLRPELPLPGLPDAAAQLALPLVVSDRLVGVIAVESRNPLAFDDWHETFLQIVATQVAVAMDRMDGEDDDDEEVAPLRLTWYRRDECVFAGDEYLVRNVPGKILWKLVTAYAREGRTQFSNRELRLDRGLGMPEVRDNLESRLILLRKRLEEKCPTLRLRPTARGRFTLEVDGPLELDERD